MSNLPAKMRTLSVFAIKSVEKQKLNFSRSALFHMEDRVSLKYFVNGCSDNSTQKKFQLATAIHKIFENNFKFHLK